jgi:hypothetical protein
MSIAVVQTACNHGDTDDRCAGMKRVVSRRPLVGFRWMRVRRGSGESRSRSRAGIGAMIPAKMRQRDAYLDAVGWDAGPGYVKINNAGRMLFGAPIGGYKQSGMDRVMCFEHMMEMTQIKNIRIKLEQ